MVFLHFDGWSAPREPLPSQSARLDRPPGNAVDLEVPDGSTVAAVIDRFQLPPALVHLVLVNGSYVAADQRAARVLADGDALAIWPPIAGG